MEHAEVAGDAFVQGGNTWVTLRINSKHLPGTDETADTALFTALRVYGNFD
jgi:hypothetical protein